MIELTLLRKNIEAALSLIAKPKGGELGEMKGSFETSMATSLSGEETQITRQNINLVIELGEFLNNEKAKARDEEWAEFVDNEEMKLFRELFFQTPIFYKSFEDFENKQMNLTFNNENINKELHKKVKTAYESFANDKGEIEFMKTFRVDILQNI